MPSSQSFLLSKQNVLIIFLEPTKVKKLTKAFVIFGAVMLVKGMASGNLVKAHILVKNIVLFR